MLGQTKSLVASKTFWSAVLALVAIIAAQFNFDGVRAWAVDPNSVQVVLNVVAGIGMIGAMIFRATATKQISSALPAPSGTNTTQAAPLATFLALALLVGLSGCGSTIGGEGENWATGISGGLSNFFNGVNSIQATMQTPAGKSAIASLRAVYRGTVCGLAVGSTFTKEIAVDVKATKTVNDTAIVMAISSTLCTSAGGVVAP